MLEIEHISVDEKFSDEDQHVDEMLSNQNLGGSLPGPNSWAAETNHDKSQHDHTTFDSVTMLLSLQNMWYLEMAQIMEKIGGLPTKHDQSSFWSI